MKSIYENEYEKHGHLKEEIFKYSKDKFDAGILENFENYMNFLDLSNYQESIKMWLISRGDITLEIINNKTK